MADRDGVWWNVHQPVAILTFYRLEAGQIGSILRLLTFRVEPDTQLDIVLNILADSVIVNIERNLRARQQQLAGVGAIQIIALADRPLHQHRAAPQIVGAA